MTQLLMSIPHKPPTLAATLIPSKFLGPSVFHSDRLASLGHSIVPSNTTRNLSLIFFARFGFQP